MSNIKSPAMKYTKIHKSEITSDMIVGSLDARKLTNIVKNNRIITLTITGAFIKKLYVIIVLIAFAITSGPYIIPNGVGFSSPSAHLLLWRKVYP